MILVTYATFQQMHGRKSSIQELILLLRRYSRDSVISLCSFVSILLKLWDYGSLHQAHYDHLISCAFEGYGRIGTDWRPAFRSQNSFSIVASYF
jgi:hypothetical protein